MDINLVHGDNSKFEWGSGRVKAARYSSGHTYINTCEQVITLPIPPFQADEVRVGIQDFFAVKVQTARWPGLIPIWRLGRCLAA